MVKKLVLNCKFPSGAAPVNFFIGNPSKDSHPIGFQSEWLAEQYGGSVPSEIMDSMEELHGIAVKNKLSFEDLCEHVFKEVNAINSINGEKALRQKQLDHISKADPIAASQVKGGGANPTPPAPAQQQQTQQPRPAQPQAAPPPQKPVAAQQQAPTPKKQPVNNQPTPSNE